MHDICNYYMKMKLSVQERVTQKVIQKMEEWVPPWSPKYSQSLQMSWSSWEYYRGINQLMLSMERMEKQYSSDIRHTFNSTKAEWWTVRKWEKSTPIMFYRKYEQRNPTHPRADENWMVERFAAQLYHVFNQDQTTLKNKKRVEPEQSNVDVDNNILTNYLKTWPKLIHGWKPCYIPAKDIIIMPNPNDFDNMDEYRGTTAHEAIHSTGSEWRLNRDWIANIDVDDLHKYSFEELVANMGRLFVSQAMRLQHCDFDNEVAYIQHRKEKISNDRNLIIKASSEAWKAYEHILSKSL